MFEHKEDIRGELYADAENDDGSPVKDRSVLKIKPLLRE
jgi:hypothetical protein